MHIKVAPNGRYLNVSLSHSTAATPIMVKVKVKLLVQLGFTKKQIEVTVSNFVVMVTTKVDKATLFSLGKTTW